MKRIHWIAILIVAYAGQANAQEHHHEEEERDKAEIRVYLADKEKRPVDLKGTTATLVIEPQAGGKRTLTMKAVAPKGSKSQGLGHGGEVREMGDYLVEFAVVKPHAQHGGDGHGLEKKDATPYFAVEFPLIGYTCSMHPDVLLEEPGKCPTCSMETKPVNLEFSAVVIFRIGGETLNVKGFEYPPAVPDNYKDAVARLEDHLETIQGLIHSGDLEKVHAIAEKISHVCTKLPDLAPHHDESKVEKICETVIGLFKEIDAAADAGKKKETIEVFEKYKSKVDELKRHVTGDHKEDHGGDHDDH
ncbi:MAG: heavy metal-binding domain-containing protein [Planctomycetota bacterium]|nr:heavy metal-binding domain-containing protein [Planctomycetota bacterium]